MLRTTLRIGMLLCIVPLLGAQACPPLNGGIAIGVGVDEREADFGGGGRGCSRFLCDPTPEEAAAILFAAAFSFAIYAANSRSNSPGGQPGSDLRLKRDIKPVAAFNNGLNLFSFKYLDDDTAYVGVIAQDLLDSDNEAFRQAVITRPDGYYAVDYDKLGIGLVTLERFLQTAREICRQPNAGCHWVAAGSLANPALG